MKLRRWLLILPVLATMTGIESRADSIWDRRDPRYANLFQDNRARNIGDQLIVTISETTTAKDTESRNNSKNNTSTGTASGPLVVNSSNVFNRTFAGSAQLNSSRTFTDQIAATVVDVLPNGNLVVEGYRSRVVAGEERVLRITGTVRPADITVGNIIASTSIANAKLSYLGRGAESRFVNQNYFGRLVNVIWPW